MLDILPFVLDIFSLGKRLIITSSILNGLPLPLLNMIIFKKLIHILENHALPREVLVQLLLYLQVDLVLHLEYLLEVQLLDLLLLNYWSLLFDDVEKHVFLSTIEPRLEVVVADGVVVKLAVVVVEVEETLLFGLSGLEAVDVGLVGAADLLVVLLDLVLLRLLDLFGHNRAVV